MPSFQDSSSHGASFQLPYYHVISDNRDLTFSPRIYSADVLAQTEYREKNSNSEHLLDFSFVNKDNASTKSHLFLGSKKNLNFTYFDESELSLKIQQVTNDTYLKTYKLKSPLIKDYNTLNSNLEFEAYKEGLDLNINFEVYEDLTKKKNDRYEYSLPNYNLNKNLVTSKDFNGNFSLNSAGFIKNFNTNVLEKVIINDFVFNSDSIFSNKGLKNNYNYIIKNVNTDGKRSTKYKGGYNSELASIFEFNTAYPLQKQSNQYTSIFKPIVSLRYSPNDSNNIQNKNRRIDTNNAFSLNRIGENDSIEGGASVTYGTEYSRLSIDDRQIVNAKLVNIYKPKEDHKLPKNSSLGQKTSDIFGSVSFSPNKIWSVEYDFTKDQNLSDTHFEVLKNQININNFVTTFEYLNENNTDQKETFLSNKTTYNFDNSNNISFSTRKNKKTKLTEFYNLIYEYQNDID